MVLASALLSSLTLLLVALVGARLSGPTVSVRLRLGRVGGWVTLAAVVSFFSLSQSLDSCFALAGREFGGTLELLAAAVRRADGPLLGIMMLSLSVLAGIGEELFFRGFMQTRLQRRWGPWPAIVITAVAFGLIHLDPVHAPLACLSGLLLGWITEQTGSVLPAVAAHVVNNGLWVLTVALMPETLPRAVHAGLLAVFVVAGVTAIVALRRAQAAGCYG
jgi:membrane protease YdiL (CAAX protease family)